MAMGLTVIGKPWGRRQGKYTYVRGTLAFDNSYPTNGLVYSGVIKNEIELHCFVVGGFEFQVDYTNKKIKVFVQDAVATNPLAEAANARDLSVVCAAVPFEAYLFK